MAPQFARTKPSDVMLAMSCKAVGRPPEMYLRISRETENSLIRTREKIQSLQDTKEERKVNKSEIKDYEYKIRKLIDIDNPSRELIQALIDKIIIDKDRNIEIIYKFSILNN